MIEREIEYNRETLRSIEHVESDLVEYDARPLLRSSFKDELRRALSDGGSVRYIRNLQLLDSIGKTYHLIRELKYLDDKMLFIYCISRSSQDELNTLFGEIESQVINSSYPLFDTTSALLGELGAELCTLRKRRESIAE